MILPETITRAGAYLGSQIGGNLLALSSTISIMALCCTLAMTILIAVPWQRTRRLRPAVLIRALLPRRLIRSRSGRADIAWALFGILFAGAAIGWALFSSQRISAVAAQALVAAFGPPAPSDTPPWLASLLLTVALFLAYEFAYWLDHWLSHKIPALWEFHKVHHSAESLSLLTNFRVHPVDTIIFYNLVALITGLVAAIVNHMLGRPIDAFRIGDTNLLVYISAIAITHVQHSHFWVRFGARGGRILLGPAHHQIHHSDHPAHHDRNFGGSLALWDRLFGTFHMPGARREQLTFGVDGMGHDPLAAMVSPCVALARKMEDRWPVNARAGSKAGKA